MGNAASTAAKSVTDCFNQAPPTPPPQPESMAMRTIAEGSSTASAVLNAQSQIQPLQRQLTTSAEDSAEESGPGQSKPPQRESEIPIEPTSDLSAQSDPLPQHQLPRARIIDGKRVHLSFTQNLARQEARRDQYLSRAPPEEIRQVAAEPDFYRHSPASRSLSLGDMRQIAHPSVNIEPPSTVERSINSSSVISFKRYNPENLQVPNYDDDDRTAEIEAAAHANMSKYKGGNYRVREGFLKNLRQYREERAIYREVLEIRQKAYLEGRGPVPDMSDILKQKHSATNSDSGAMDDTFLIKRSVLDEYRRNKAMKLEQERQDALLSELLHKDIMEKEERRRAKSAEAATRQPGPFAQIRGRLEMRAGAEPREPFDIRDMPVFQPYHPHWRADDLKMLRSLADFQQDPTEIP